MASGSRLTFLDPATLRSIYPGNFSTEFMFRSPGNLFSTVQFIPERVIEFSISPEGIRFYKVQWQETWVPEHSLSQYQSLIEVFWRSQSELAGASCDNEQSTSSTPVSDVIVSQSKNKNVSESFLTTLQSNSVTLDSQIGEETIHTHPVTSVIGKAIGGQPITPSTDLHILKHQVKQPDLFKQQEFIKHHEHQEIVAKQQQDFIKLRQDFSKQHDFEILVRRHDDANIQNQQIDNDNVLNLPNIRGLTDQNKFITLEVPPLIEESVANITHIRGDNELTKIISPKFKKKKRRSLKMEGFELANVEHPTATDEELRQQAKDVLSSFHGKRFPNGSSKLPQTCFFCTKVLSTGKKLREHQFSIHIKNVGEFLCGICQQRFMFRWLLKTHMITHSDNRNYVCKLCGLTCKRNAHLYTHMATHQKERNYRCDVCHQNFKVQAELKEHCLAEHKNEKSKCNVCKQTLHTPYSVYVHSMRHSGTRDHICQLCGASFKRKQHLLQHHKIHENQTENIKCPVCDKEFPEKNQFRKHLEMVHKELASNYRYDYICTICDKDFAYKGRLDLHMKMHAEKTEEIKNVRSRRKKGDTLKDEERSVRVRKKRKKVDTLTDDALDKLSDKIEKITDPKTGEAKLKCKLCHRKEFRLISAMEKHLEDHETGKATGTFECVICKKTFCSEARLLRHNIIHQATAAKPKTFQCKQCGKSFKWKGYLQAHTKKCTPMSKGAGKRKATLKAREKLRRQVEIGSCKEEPNAVQGDVKPTEMYDFSQEGEEGRLDDHMKIHPEKTDEERNVRLQNKKVDTLTDDALDKFSDKIEKVTDPKSGEVKLKCKLCRHREFRLTSTMEKHLEEHEATATFCKGAGKRKASLKAKVKLQLQIEDGDPLEMYDISQEEEEEEEEIQLDDDPNSEILIEGDVTVDEIPDDTAMSSRTVQGIAVNDAMSTSENLINVETVSNIIEVTHDGAFVSSNSNMST